MKRAFLIHGWSGSPNGAWRPWLTRELETRGWTVASLAMPDTDNPRIETWVPYLAEAVGVPDEETILVGHSIGCQTILRYLAGLSDGQRIGGAYLVAGWMNLSNIKSEEEQAITKPWLETSIDLEKAKRAANRIIGIFSDNDPFVPLANEVVLREKLGAKTIIVSGMGHIGEDDGITELPMLLDEILR